MAESEEEYKGETLGDILMDWWKGDEEKVSRPPTSFEKDIKEAKLARKKSGGVADLKKLGKVRDLDPDAEGYLKDDPAVLQDELTMYGQVQDSELQRQQTWESMVPGVTGTSEQAAYLTNDEYLEGETTVLESLINSGMEGEEAFAKLEKEGVEPTTPITYYLEARAKKSNKEKDLTPTERMKLRGTDLNEIAKEKRDADEAYSKTLSKFVEKKAALEQGFHGHRLDLMAEEKKYLLADAEDADKHAKEVKRLNTKWGEEEVLYDKGTKALFQMGMSKLGISFDEKGNIVKGDPTEKQWGIGPPGFTTADGSFSALRTAHSTFWILGVFANTAMSFVSALAGDKMSTIPNYITEALFKALDYDAKKATNEFTRIGQMSVQGTNAWTALNGKFKSKHARELAYTSAFSQQVSKYVGALRSNPDYAPMMKNPNFLNQVSALETKLKIHQADIKAKYKNSSFKFEMEKRSSDLKVVDREFQARRDETNAALNQLTAMRALQKKGTIKAFTKEEASTFTTFVSAHDQLMRGLAIINLVEEKQNLDPGDMLGMMNIIASKTNLAQSFGGGEMALVHELHKIGTYTGRQIMRLFESGQTTDKDADFGEDMAWMGQHSVGYIKAVIKDRLNILIRGVLSRRTLMSEEHHKKIDKVLLTSGITDPDEMMKQLASPERNGLTAGRLHGFGYNNKGLIKSQRKDLAESFSWE